LKQVTLLLSKRNQFSYAARPVASAHRAARLRLRRASGCLGTLRGSSRRLVVDYFAYAARPGASARRTARHRLLHLSRASGCFGTSRGLSRDSPSTTSPRAGSSSTTSPTPRVRVHRHIARLITRLVVDYFASCMLVVDYFAYTACPGASARRTARRRLLHLRRASGCFDTSRGLSRDSSSTTSPTPRVRVPRHVARLVA
jgi:hypothetical protein